MEWWDEEWRQAIKQKNIVKMKCFQQQSWENQEYYKERVKKQIKYVNKKQIMA
jgi:hypothetical protein